MPDPIADTTSDSATAEMAKFIGESNDPAPTTVAAPVIADSAPAAPAAPVAAEAPAIPDAADAPEATEAPKNSAQERINKAVGQQRAAQREAAAHQARADAAEAQNAALEARLAALEKGLPKVEPQAIVDPNAPDPKDFTFGELDAKYIAAITRYEIKKDREDAAAEAKKSQETAQQTEAAALLEERIANTTALGAAKYPDFEEVVLNANWPLSPTLGELVLESAYGHDIAYHLATNLDMAKQIDAMNLTGQAKWFGKLEAHFEANSPVSQGADQQRAPQVQQPGRKLTQAPPPLKFQTKGAGGKPSITPDTIDFAAFEAQAMSKRQ